MEISKNFFKEEAVSVAKKLLGKKIIHGNCSGIIVETEAYKGAEDKASHGAKKTPRSAVMHETFGCLYIYFIYGNHYCLNFTCDSKGPGAVLVRAIEPVQGIEKMQERREKKELHELCSGPGKLCQALGITKKLNGTTVNKAVKIKQGKKVGEKEIIATNRIGIKEGKEFPWRFYIKGNKFVSKK